MAPHLTDLTEARLLAASGEARRIREAARASQRDMAEQIDVSHVTIARWENGTHVPHGPPAVRWLRQLRELQRVTESLAAPR